MPVPLKTREGAGLRLGCTVAGRRVAEGGCLLVSLSLGSLRKNHLLSGSFRSSRSEGPVGSEAGQREGKEAAGMLEVPLSSEEAKFTLSLISFSHQGALAAGHSPSLAKVLH